MTKQEAIEKLESTVSKVHELRDNVWQDLASIWQPFSASLRHIAQAERAMSTLKNVEHTVL